jgi:hypothetical protein
MITRISAARRRLSSYALKVFSSMYGDVPIYVVVRGQDRDSTKGFGSCLRARLTCGLSVWH